MKIKDREIGAMQPTYVIAEMSGNHAGSLERAKQIIQEAKNAGADCIKIQTYTPDTITMNCTNEYFQIKTGTWENENLYELYGKAYTPWEWQKELLEEANCIGIDLFSTPFDKTAVDFLEGLGVASYKIASFELVDIPLLKYTASKGKPIILSTGMATFEEIREAVEAIRSTGNHQLALLRCASAYPAISEEMNLATMMDMQHIFQVPVGLSDHSMGSLAAVAAVAMGGSIIEKHFCLSRDIENPDSSFSMEPQEFANMVRDIRQVEQARGKVSYGPTAQEKNNLNFRKSIFVVKDVKENEVLTEENIRVIRPAFGLHPREYEYLLGKKVKHSLQAGTPLTLREIGDYFQVRSADASHERLLFDWANEAEVRQNSFTTEQIVWENHQVWFRNLLTDVNKRLYIFYRNNQPVGMIRYDIQDKSARISYSIAKEFRHRGYGKAMVEQSEPILRKESPQIQVITAEVKPENTASMRIFEELDYHKGEEDTTYVLYTHRCE
jgi:pseudaminic acid synthase